MICMYVGAYTCIYTPICVYVKNCCDFNKTLKHLFMLIGLAHYNMVHILLLDDPKFSLPS